jgi:hypothetical protein
VDHCLDGFDFNELIRAAEDCDAQERTWHVMRAEGLANDCPSLNEVAPVGRSSKADACAKYPSTCHISGLLVKVTVNERNSGSARVSERCNGT